MLPSHESIVPIEDSDIGRGWRRVATGEPIKTWMEAFILFPPAGWRLSSFFTSDKQYVTGRTVYRSPASIAAWASLIAPLARKWWDSWTKTPSTL